MSLNVVKKRIEAIKAKPVVTASDMQVVVTAAERSQRGRADGVSNAEGREVADFHRLASAAATAPSKINAPVLDDGAVSVLNAFFMRNGLPYGDNRKPMKDRVLAILPPDAELGRFEMDRQPRVGSLQPLKLSKETDAVRKMAYVDAVKKLVIIKVTSDTADAKFYGPFGLDGNHAAAAAKES